MLLSTHQDSITFLILVSINGSPTIKFFIIINVNYFADRVDEKFGIVGSTMLSTKYPFYPDHVSDNHHFSIIQFIFKI